VGWEDEKCLKLRWGGWQEGVGSQERVKAGARSEAEERLKCRKGL